MKRFVIALLLLTATMGTSLGEIFYVSRSADGFLDRIEAADALVKRGELNSALQICEQLEDSWDNTAEKIDILLIHDYVDSIGVSLSQMKAHLENRNADMYFSDSASAKKGLASIKGSEYPNFENIL